MRTLVLLLKKKNKTIKKTYHLGRLAREHSPSAPLDFFFESTFSFLQNAFRKGDVKFVREESWHPWSRHSVFWCGVSRTK